MDALLKGRNPAVVTSKRRESVIGAMAAPPNIKSMNEVLWKTLRKLYMIDCNAKNAKYINLSRIDGW